MPEASSIAFISYAWESEAHQEWVLRLATDLRRNAIDVILDRWDLQAGDDIAAFMDQSIARARHLLLVCSDAFAEKADARRGGVGYEYGIITGELLTSPATAAKLVPILRQGAPSTALPRYLKTRLFIDFRDDQQYERSREQLLRHLFGAHEHPRPELGIRPTFADSGAPRPASTELHPSGPPRKWVLVAGTGVISQFTERLREVSVRLGQELAASGSGLVTGGWPGVDDAVGRAFAAEVVSRNWPLEDFLTQVIPADEEPAFPAGNLFVVRKGTAEWTEAIDRADAIVLIGGMGGTWTTGEIALEKGKPVFPLADTGGDAKRLYLHILSNWDRLNMAGFTKSQFQRVARPAPGVARDVVGLIGLA